MSKSIRKWRTGLVGVAALAMSAGLLGFPLQAQAQQRPAGAFRDTVRGRVTDAQTGEPVPGVVVQVMGTRRGTLTNQAGLFMVPAASDAVLVFNHLAYHEARIGVAGRGQVDVPLDVAATQLNELVVTGYSSQRRGEITGAVASVGVAATTRETSSSVLKNLGGHVAGVITENSGSPGARSTIRVRGISSFQNNDPLYVIDGTPVNETYGNFLDPNDIESIQVLKDASAASIYGSRANNGVVIIQTKRGGGGAPQITMNAKFGMQTPVKGYDSILIQNPLDLFQVIKASYTNAGLPVPPTVTAIYGDPSHPSIPQYIWAEGSALTGTDQWGRFQVDPTKYSYPNTLVMPGSAGTDWWNAVFRSAPTRDLNLGVSGGADNSRYYASFGYFDQEGTAIGSRYTRGSVRINTDFTSGRLRVGENMNLALELSHGGLDDGGLGEGNIVGKNVFMPSVVPIYDTQGNYASGKANGLSNDSNPLKIAQGAEHNINTNSRVFGNVFGQLALTHDLNVRSSLGFNYGNGAYRGYNPPTFENSEETGNNSFNDNHNYFIEYTENTTLNYQHMFSNVHNFTLLLGQEANAGTSRNEDGTVAGLISTDLASRYIQDALADPSTKNVTTYGGTSTLLSYFGKANYDYANKYYLSVTVRRDGSSRLGPSHRWGVFPAASVGWRVSRESFLKNNSFLTNLMLRFGYGITGNQNIAAGRTIDAFGGSTGTSFYNIGGGGNNIVTGYTLTDIGNSDLKWEQNKSSDLGMDAEFLGGKANFTLDLYRRDITDLLFNPPLPATAGRANPPIVNVGAMRNDGVDFEIGYRANLGRNTSWNVSLNGSHYKNTIREIAGDTKYFFGPTTTRFSTQSVTINKLGYAIGSFYGQTWTGTMFKDQAQIDALNAAARQKKGDPTAVYQDGAAPGRLMFKDVNGDGVVNADDLGPIGSPNPSFTGGLTLGLNYKRFDVGATVFGTFGNKIYNAQKEFDVFRLFDENCRQDLLSNSWTPNNLDAKYPRLDINDKYSSQPSSYYVENGSYVRLRSLQLGYAVPPKLLPGYRNVRVYLEAENLFTITGYDELDPALPAQAATSAGMDVRDQSRGIDRGVYPTNRVFSVGFSIGF
jgi:TonB-linked SusC/RagA family outer membrane protein